jgi:hypothetical protein
MSNTITLLHKDELTEIVKTAIEEVLKTNNNIRKSAPIIEKEEVYLTAKQVKERYEISRTMLASLQSRGKLRLYKINSKNYYRNSDIIELIENSRKKYGLE